MSGVGLFVYMKIICLAILSISFKSNPKSWTFAIGLDIQCLFLHLCKWVEKEFEFLININLVRLGRELAALFI